MLKICTVWSSGTHWLTKFKATKWILMILMALNYSISKAGLLWLQQRNWFGSKKSRHENKLFNTYICFSDTAFFFPLRSCLLIICQPHHHSSCTSRHCTKLSESSCSSRYYSQTVKINPSFTNATFVTQSVTGYQNRSQDKLKSGSHSKLKLDPVSHTASPK